MRAKSPSTDRDPGPVCNSAYAQAQGCAGAERGAGAQGDKPVIGGPHPAPATYAGAGSIEDVSNFVRGSAGEAPAKALRRPGSDFRRPRYEMWRATKGKSRPADHWSEGSHATGRRVERPQKEIRSVLVVETELVISTSTPPIRLVSPLTGKVARSTKLPPTLEKRKYEAKLSLQSARIAPG
jgi:hypothetical protein